jgi:hypothetical protein
MSKSSAITRTVVVLFCVVVLGRCSSDDSAIIPDVDMTGTWFLTADAARPPATFACSGEHSGMGNTALCSPFVLDLQQDERVVSGTSTQAYCGFDFTVSGTVSGDRVAGEFVLDDGVVVQRITYIWTVTDDTGIVEPQIFSQDGLSGSCTVGGFYRALR